MRRQFLPALLGLKETRERIKCWLEKTDLQPAVAKASFFRFGLWQVTWGRGGLRQAGFARNGHEGVKFFSSLKDNACKSFAEDR